MKKDSILKKIKEQAYNNFIMTLKVQKMLIKHRQIVKKYLHCQSVGNIHIVKIL